MLPVENENTAAPEALKARFEHEAMAARFREVYYEPGQNLYCRISQGPKKTVFDKAYSQYLTVMKEDGSSIKEMVLPASFTNRYVFLEGCFNFVLSNGDDSSLRVAVVPINSYF